MIVKYKIVKHNLSFHVIAYTGTLKTVKGQKSTYKEQCISSHFRGLGGLARANKALLSYKAAGLKISKFAEPRTLRKVIAELHFGFWVAIVAAIGVEMYIKFIIHA